MKKDRTSYYLIESNPDIISIREKALNILQSVKEVEEGKKLIPVWIDFQTVKLIDIEKIKRKGMVIIKVKLPVNGRIVWMEKRNAVKRGYISE